MQEELDGLAFKYPARFKIYYVLNQVSCKLKFSSAVNRDDNVAEQGFKS